MKAALLFLAGCFAGFAAAEVDLGPLLARAERSVSEGRWVEARETYFRAAGLSRNEEEKANILETLGELNLKLLLSPYEQPETVWVAVQPRDTLAVIAERAGTTVELLMKMNRLTSDTIRLGRRLKVPIESFSVEVNKATNELTLRLGDRFFKRYPVSTGARDNTPVGSFRITDRLVHPDWWHPETGRRYRYGEPGHRIGTHWLGWDRRGFGIHGTDEPEKIGQPVSLGCVRMRNEDVAELYLLLPRGTRVVVKDR